MGTPLRVFLPETERVYLEGLLADAGQLPHVLLRARMLLLANRTSGQWTRYEQIAAELGCTTSPVSMICRQYVTQGLQAALRNNSCDSRKPRPGKITAEVADCLRLLVQDHPPEGHKSWTLKLLAGHLVDFGLVSSISQVAVYKFFKKEGTDIKKSRPAPVKVVSPGRTSGRTSGRQ